MLSTLNSVLSRCKRCTVLRSPPITPVAGETSLATIQSQPLRLIFAFALSIRCSVSAAKPITSGGGLVFVLENVGRGGGVFPGGGGGVPGGGLFNFFSAPFAA